MTPTETRVAGPRDTQRLSVTMAEAFGADPVWGWAFPDGDMQQVWWHFWLAGAIPQGEVRMTAGAEAAAVWIPPGGRELLVEDEAHIPVLLRALTGARADLVLETLDRFDAHHPHTAPHYYLSLLGTADAHRGRGIGMALLGENLERIDVQHAPAYLESSNPGNLDRYERVGFVPIGEFRLPDERTVVTTMWRDPR